MGQAAHYCWLWKGKLFQVSRASSSPPHRPSLVHLVKFPSVLPSFGGGFPCCVLGMAYFLSVSIMVLPIRYFPLFPQRFPVFPHVPPSSPLIIPGFPCSQAGRSKGLLWFRAHASGGVCEGVTAIFCSRSPHTGVTVGVFLYRCLILDIVSSALAFFL